MEALAKHQLPPSRLQNVAAMYQTVRGEATPAEAERHSGTPLRTLSCPKYRSRAAIYRSGRSGQKLPSVPTIWPGWNAT
ncbi:MAG: hypothetical protein ACTHOP_23270, partial [Mesorhizobium sp.]